MGTDAATVRDFLADYRERNARDELLLALDASGTVVARSDTFAAAAAARRAGRRGSSRRCRASRAFGVIDVDGRPHHMALVPAEAGGTIFGFVAAAAPVDDRWAAALRDAGGSEIVVLDPAGVAGTTLAQDRAAVANAPADVPGRRTAVHDVDLGGERFEAMSVARSARAVARGGGAAVARSGARAVSQHPARSGAARRARRGRRHRRQRDARPFHHRAAGQALGARPREVAAGPLRRDARRAPGRTSSAQLSRPSTR